MAHMDDPTINDFESALAELETIVDALEKGDLTLEQSLAKFERGITLSRYCHDRLTAAEKRVELLTERGDLTPAPDDLASGVGAEADDAAPPTQETGRVSTTEAAEHSRDDDAGDDDFPF